MKECASLTAAEALFSRYRLQTWWNVGRSDCVRGCLCELEVNAIIITGHKKNVAILWVAQAKRQGNVVCFGFRPTV